MNVKRLLIARLKIDPAKGQICLTNSDGTQVMSIIGLEFVNDVPRFTNLSIDGNKVALHELQTNERFSSEIEEMLADVLEGVLSKMDEGENVPCKKSFLERLNKHIQQFFESEYGG